MDKKVYVAMSGGVDSSVAAALLKEQGYSVVGVFMKFWSPEANTRRVYGPKHPSGGLGYCLWKEERADAARVAAKLGISLLTWDFTQEYEKKVVNYMLEAYKAGITPNPDIMCNKEIKFGMFFERAIAEGADYVATGHYSRISCGNPKSEFLISNKIPNPKSQIPNSSLARVIMGEGRGEGSNTAVQRFNNYQLIQAVDKNKDQSYFLYTLEQRHLERTLFPIGGYTKPEVRDLAKKFDLPTAEKKDSQGVCFIGPLKMKEFLKDYIKPKKGKVFLSKIAGQQNSRTVFDSLENAYTLTRLHAYLLGFHDGAWYYTIGQRHGIDLKLAGGPYYVIGKNIEKNEIYVGSEDELYSDLAKVNGIHWICEAPKLPAKIGVKIRYRSETMPASINSQPKASNNNNLAIQQFNNCSTTESNDGADLIVKFNKSARAITPGQAAVFYDGEKVLGGGIIV